MKIEFKRTKDGKLKSITIKNPTSDDDPRFLEEIDALIRNRLMKPENYSKPK